MVEYMYVMCAKSSCLGSRRITVVNCKNTCVILGNKTKSTLFWHVVCSAVYCIVLFMLLNV